MSISDLHGLSATLPLWINCYGNPKEEKNFFMLSHRRYRRHFSMAVILELKSSWQASSEEAGISGRRKS